MPAVPAGSLQNSRRSDPRRPWRPAGRAVLALLACLFATLPVEGVAADAAANQLKAEMVCNMAKFVRWPDAVAVTGRGQLVVTILGEDELAEALASVLSSRLVNGRPVFVRFARRARDVQGSHLVYVAASESTKTVAILADLAGTPVLTVGDRPGFTADGGMVSFSGSAPQMRFDIALGRAERAGLRISSRLLALSRVVDAGP